MGTTTEAERSRIHDLLQDLQRPSYVYKMAMADTRSNSGAAKRISNSMKEMQEILDRYVEERFTQLHPNYDSFDYKLGRV